MARTTGGTKVSGGYYWNPRRGSLIPVTDEGGTLPGTSSDRYLRVPWMLALLLAPVIGGLYVVLLPFVGLALFLRAAWRWATGSAREGAKDLAATLTPGWRPGEVHMTGRALDGKGDENLAGGAGESALEDVAEEVARKRRGNGDD